MGLHLLVDLERRIGFHLRFNRVATHPHQPSIARDADQAAQRHPAFRTDRTLVSHHFRVHRTAISFAGRDRLLDREGDRLELGCRHGCNEHCASAAKRAEDRRSKLHEGEKTLHHQKNILRIKSPRWQQRPVPDQCSHLHKPRAEVTSSGR